MPRRVCGRARFHPSRCTSKPHPPGTRVSRLAPSRHATEQRSEYRGISRLRADQLPPSRPRPEDLRTPCTPKTTSARRPSPPKKNSLRFIPLRQKSPHSFNIHSPNLSTINLHNPPPPNTLQPNLLCLSDTPSPMSLRGTKQSAPTNTLPYVFARYEAIYADRQVQKLHGAWQYK